MATTSAHDSIYIQGRLQADLQPENNSDALESPGVMQGLQNVIEDAHEVDLMKVIKETGMSMASDALQPIRALFSPMESTSNAILSVMGDSGENAAEVFGRSMLDANTRQDTKNYAGQAAEKLFPDMDPNNKVLASLGLSMATDPSNWTPKGLIGGVGAYGVRSFRKALKQTAKAAETSELKGLAKEALKPDATTDAKLKLMEGLMGGEATSLRAAELNAMSDYSRLQRVGPNEQQAVLKIQGEWLGEQLAGKYSGKKEAQWLLGKTGGKPGFIRRPSSGVDVFREDYLNINTPYDVDMQLKTRVDKSKELLTRAVKYQGSDLVKDRVLVSREDVKTYTVVTEGTVEALTDEQAVGYSWLLRDLDEGIRHQVTNVRAPNGDIVMSPADRIRFVTLLGARATVTSDLAKGARGGGDSNILLQAASTPGPRGVKVVAVNRAFGGMKRDLPSVNVLIDAHTSAAENLTGPQLRTFIRSITDDLSMSPDAAKAIDPNDPALVKSVVERVNNLAHRAWMTSILSGPFTHARNLSTNTLELLANTASNLPASGLAVLNDLKVGVVGALGTLRVARKVRRSPTSIGSLADFRRQHESATLSPKLSGGKVKGLAPLKKTAHWTVAQLDAFGPLAALGGSDAVFKSINYKVSLMGSARAAAKLALPKGSAEELKALTDSLSRDGSFLMQQEAFKQAERRTFQSPVDELFGESVADMARGLRTNPVTKWLAPFTTTPLNIIAAGIRYTPFSAALRETRAAFSEGSRAEKLLQFGKITLPTAAFVAIADQMPADRVTGRANSYTTQNQLPPYSILINGGWVSYEKIDPLRWTLGPIADAVELRHRLDWDASDASGKWLKYLGAVTGGFIGAVDDAMFLDTLSDVSKIVAVAGVDATEGEITIEPVMKILRKYFRPPAALTQTRRLLPGANRSEYHTFMEGLHGEVPDQIGLLGEPQPYQYFKPTGEHPVYERLRRLNMPIPRLPKLINGHETTSGQRAEFRFYRAFGGDAEYVPSSKTPWRDRSRRLPDSLGRVTYELLNTPEFNSLPPVDQKTMLQSYFNIATKNAKYKMMERHPKLQVPVPGKL